MSTHRSKKRDRYRPRKYYDRKRDFWHYDESSSSSRRDYLPPPETPDHFNQRFHGKNLNSRSFLNLDQTRNHGNHIGLNQNISPQNPPTPQNNSNGQNRSIIQSSPTGSNSNIANNSNNLSREPKPITILTDYNNGIDFERLYQRRLFNEEEFICRGNQVCYDLQELNIRPYRPRL